MADKTPMLTDKKLGELCVGWLGWDKPVSDSDLQLIKNFLFIVEPYYIEKGRQMERERMIRNLGLLVAKGFTLRQAIMAIKDSILEQALKGVAND